MELELSCFILLSFQAILSSAQKRSASSSCSQLFPLHPAVHGLLLRSAERSPAEGPDQEVPDHHQEAEAVGIHDGQPGQVHRHAPAELHHEALSRGRRPRRLRQADRRLQGPQVHHQPRVESNHFLPHPLRLRRLAVADRTRHAEENRRQKAGALRQGLGEELRHQHARADDHSRQDVGLRSLQHPVGRCRFADEENRFDGVQRRHGLHGRRGGVAEEADRAVRRAFLFGVFRRGSDEGGHDEFARCAPLQKLHEQKICNFS